MSNFASQNKTIQEQTYQITISSEKVIFATSVIYKNYT